MAQTDTYIRETTMMGILAIIQDWPPAADSFLEWEDAFEGEGDDVGRFRFTRPAKTLTSRESGLFRSIWALCEMEQISWTHYNDCLRVLSVHEYSQIFYSEGSRPLIRSEVDAIMNVKIESMAEERGVRMAAFENAVRACAEATALPDLRLFLRDQLAYL